MEVIKKTKVKLEKKTMFEVKYTLDGINCNLNIAEEKISD